MCQLGWASLLEELSLWSLEILSYLYKSPALLDHMERIDVTWRGTRLQAQVLARGM